MAGKGRSGKNFMSFLNSEDDDIALSSPFGRGVYGPGHFFLSTKAARCSSRTHLSLCPIRANSHKLQTARDQTNEREK